MGVRMIVRCSRCGFKFLADGDCPKCGPEHRSGLSVVDDCPCRACVRRRELLEKFAEKNS